MRYFGRTVTRYDAHGMPHTEDSPESASIAELASEISESNRLKRIELMFLMSGKRMSPILLEEVTKDGTVEVVQDKLKWR